MGANHKREHASLFYGQVEEHVSGSSYSGEYAVEID